MRMQQKENIEMKYYNIKRYLFLAGLSIILCGCKKELTWQDQYDLGMKYLNEGDYEEALTAFSAAIKIEPQQVEAYIGRADTYAQIAAQISEEGEADTVADKNYELAEADYTKVLELDEENEDAYVKLTDLALAREDFDEAEQLIQTGTEKTGSEKLQEKQDEIRAKDEERLKTIFEENTTDPLREFVYDDFDADGTYEAFAITATDYTPGDAGEFYGVSIWYVNSEGTVSWVGTPEYGDFYGVIDTGSQKFISWEKIAGSAGTSFIYGVRNQVPYEPQISQRCDFFQQEDGKIFSLDSDFSAGYHDYIEITYGFNEATGEFNEQ